MSLGLQKKTTNVALLQPPVEIVASGLRSADVNFYFLESLGEIPELPSLLREVPHPARFSTFPIWPV